jgi:serine/threonine-protein kinase
VIGRTIGSYVVKEKIGQGGMGAVYLAEHPRIHKQVAIKVLLPEYGKDPVQVHRFFNEAKSVNEIRNEHIIDIIDFGELPEDGVHYIIMEWLDGRSLSSVLEAEPKLPVPRAVHIARGIGRALAAAHQKGVVHRDLKPDNIFLLQRGEDPDFAKVLDFGIAKLMGEDQAKHMKTQTGQIVGTPYFMAPEQCRGQPIDPRTDVYALGCIVYRMLAGKLPFEASALGELLVQHMMVPPKPLREQHPEIPAGVEFAVLKAMEKEPAARWQRVEEFLAALSEIQTGVHSRVPTPAFGTPVYTASTSQKMDTIGHAAGQAVPKPKSKTPILVAGGVAVAIGFGAVAFVMNRHEVPPAPPPAPKVAAVSTPPPAPAPAPAPVPAAPAAAHLTIRTTPPTAEIRIDDAKVANPFEGDFPKNDLRHRIEVKASGFRSEAEWVTFEQDRALEIALVKGSGTHESSKHAKLPAPPPSTAPAPVAAAPSKPEPKAESKKEEKADPNTKIYKGTKGKLITDFPE